MATRPNLATLGHAVATRPQDRSDAPTRDRAGRDPDPARWPVLVTGAGGFVGGHIARNLASAGHFVRGLTRRPPHSEAGDRPIEWLVGDLRDPEVRARALLGVRGVIHAASWVSLGPDRLGESHSINV